MQEEPSQLGGSWLFNCLGIKREGKEALGMQYLKLKVIDIAQVPKINPIKMAMQGKDCRGAKFSHKTFWEGNLWRLPELTIRVILLSIRIPNQFFVVTE